MRDEIITVRVKNLTGLFGRKQQKVDGNMLSLSADNHYDIQTKGARQFLIDDKGRKVKVDVKPYQKSNKCEFQVFDWSASEAHADLIIIGGEFDTPENK